jgi:hypothetical protein
MPFMGLIFCVVLLIAFLAVAPRFLIGWLIRALNQPWSSPLK